MRLKYGVAILCFCVSAAAVAKVSEDQAEQLGDELTPLGAEKAGKEEAVSINGVTLNIPEWDGGLPKREEKIDPANPPPNPYKDEKPLFTITGANVADYAQLLTDGQKQLFKTFPKTFKMNVYQSHRTASFPEDIYEETEKNATRVEISNQGNGFTGTVRGYPFPIPQSGREVMWNHMARYRTTGFRGYINHAITTSGGAFVVERAYIELAFRYNHPETTFENFQNQDIFLMRKVVAPPNKAGDSVLLHVPLDRVKDETLVWTYNPGTRKVRRIGEVGYDNPAFDGMITHDQIDMFNGPMDRYQFKLLGKQERLIPYNDYDLYSRKLKYKKIIQPGHINQDLVRYELHRVWVVEATRLPDVAHIYSKRIFYIDEDSWLIMLQDIYDDRGEFWRTAEAHGLNLDVVPLMANPVQVHYDLQSRRYVILNMTNQEKKIIEYDFYEPPSHFTTSRLKRFAQKKHK